MKLLGKLCLLFAFIPAGSGIAYAVPILVLAETNRLLRFETTAPGFVQSQTIVTGLQANEKLLAIDFRPSNGQLYGITNGSRIYVINPTTGAATQVGSGTLSPALDFAQDIGFDFNPVNDLIRVVTDKRQNLRVNPTTAIVVGIDTPVAFANGDPNQGRTPSVAAAAFSNNMSGAASTTLYTIVMGQPQNPSVPTVLATQGGLGGMPSPDTGLLFTVGSMGFLFVEPVGMDIGQDGIAYALMNGTDTINDLYTVNLGTGAVTRIAIIGGSGDNMRDVAVIPNSVPPSGTFQFSAATFVANENSSSVTLTVNRTGDTSSAASIEFLSVDGTAVQRSDFIIAAGRLQFAPGESTKTFGILIVDDRYNEGTETFNVQLFNGTGGSIPGSPNSAAVNILDNDGSPPTTNPIDDPQFFVRQQYFDFLNREPDAGGLAYWTGQITSCGTDVACANRRRTAVSAAFFFSAEFQDTGYFVIRLFQVGFVRRPGYLEFTQSRNRIVAGSNLEASKTAFLNEFMNTAEFEVRHPATDTPQRYVDDLNAGAESSLTQAERDALVAGLINGSQTRATVLRTVVDNATVRQRFFNRSFVVMQYHGYLRRTPEAGGFSFWLDILDRTNNFNSMVCAFTTSAEYQQRFSSVVNHANSECGQ